MRVEFRLDLGYGMQPHSVTQVSHYGAWALGFAEGLAPRSFPEFPLRLWDLMS